MYGVRRVGILVVVVLAGCSGNPYSNFNSPDSLTLYSLDGRAFRVGDEPKTEEKFHGYPVLGKVRITSETDRREIMRTLRRDYKSSDEYKCFWPRHGIRVSEGDKSADYVICFQCKRLQIYMNGQTRARTTNSVSRQALNKFLSDAKHPLGSRAG